MTQAHWKRDPDEDQAAHYALAMRLLARAAHLSRACLPVSQTNITQCQRDDPKRGRSNAAVRWLADAGYLENLMHEPNGSPTYRVTVAGWEKVGQTPPLWVV